MRAASRPTRPRPPPCACGVLRTVGKDARAPAGVRCAVVALLRCLHHVHPNAPSVALINVHL
eukprot:1063735-Prymnesium_polylepis.1